MKRNHIFLITGIALFLGVFPMSYGYYQLLRWLVCGTGAYGAYLSYENKKIKWAWALGVIALIFNPFMKFHLAKESWKLIDLVAGVLFCVYFKRSGK